MATKEGGRETREVARGKNGPRNVSSDTMGDTAAKIFIGRAKNPKAFCLFL